MFKPIKELSFALGLAAVCAQVLCVVGNFAVEKTKHDSVVQICAKAVLDFSNKARRMAESAADESLGTARDADRRRNSLLNFQKSVGAPYDIFTPEFCGYAGSFFAESLECESAPFYPAVSRTVADAQRVPFCARAMHYVPPIRAPSRAA